MVRQALLRPLHGGGEQRLLHGVLAGVELAVPANEHAEDLRRERTQQVLDHRCCHISVPACSITARTSSTPKPCRTSGQRAAISAARSGVSQSTVR